MNQVVNFYDKLGPEKTIPRDIVYIWITWLVVIFIYLGWSMLILSQKWAVEDKLSALERTNVELQEAIKLDALNVDERGLEILNNRLDTLRKQTQGQKLLVANLSGPQFGDLTGFSDVLLGLARQHQQGLAIESVEVTENGRVFTMSGRVIEPNDVPAYIVRLGLEPAFENMAFEKVEIVESGTQLSFTVRSWSKI